MSDSWIFVALAVVLAIMGFSAGFCAGKDWRDDKP